MKCYPEVASHLCLKGTAPRGRRLQWLGPSAMGGWAAAKRSCHAVRVQFVPQTTGAPPSPPLRVCSCFITAHFYVFAASPRRTLHPPARETCWGWCHAAPSRAHLFCATPTPCRPASPLPPFPTSLAATMQPGRLLPHPCAKVACCAMPCHVISCHAVVHCAALCCAGLSYPVLGSPPFT